MMNHKHNLLGGKVKTMGRPTTTERGLPINFKNKKGIMTRSITITRMRSMCRRVKRIKNRKITTKKGIERNDFKCMIF